MRRFAEWARFVFSCHAFLRPQEGVQVGELPRSPWPRAGRCRPAQPENLLYLTNDSCSCLPKSRNSSCGPETTVQRSVSTCETKSTRRCPNSHIFIRGHKTCQVQTFGVLVSSITNGKQRCWQHLSGHPIFAAGPWCRRRSGR